ncbi:MAG: DUF4388 domain-containing protein [Myxococcota bacterium]
MRTLIADYDEARAKGIAEACIARGLVVENAPQGAAALELALERVPDMIICPVELPVIDGLRLAEILRANPRTRGVGFLFLVRDELDAPMAMDPRDAIVPSPWLVEDVLHHVDLALERTTRFGSAPSDSEISGKLSQISLLDLLQVFQMNRKTGTLRISQAGGRGSGAVLVRAGQVVDASIPLSDGTTLCREKALFRLLTWLEGRFEFLPGDTPVRSRIQLSMRSLLLEGMRQKDELQKRRGDLPADISRLRVAARPEDIRSVPHRGIREVLDAVQTYQRVSEIVDHCSMPDYQVLCALSDLLGRGVLTVEQPRGLSGPGFAEGDGNIFPASEIRRLREWASSVRPRSGPVIKVPVVSAEKELLDAFREALAESADFLPDPRMARQPRRSGSLGHFALGEGLSLRLIALPADPAYGPLWEVTAYGMLGAILLSTAGAQGHERDTTGTAFAAIARRGDASVARLVLDRSGAALARTDDSTFVLREDSGASRLEVLQNLFASLLP